MIALNIDISGPVEEFELLLDESKNLSNKILDRITHEYMQKWEDLVGSSLNKTKAEYLKAMRHEKIDEYNLIIRLDPRESRLALMLEDGADPFDIKDHLAAGKRKITIGGGWYVDVPFRFAGSRALGTSPVFSGKLPAAVERMAKKLSPAAVPQSKLPKEYQEPKKRDKITTASGKVYPTYTHKVSIYDRVRRIQTGKRSGKYMSFRRVSEASDENSWIHKGFTARKFMDQTLNDLDIQTILDSVLQDYLNNR